MIESISFINKDKRKNIDDLNSWMGEFVDKPKIINIQENIYDDYEELVVFFIYWQ